MTSTTRRRLFVCAVALAVTIPAETILVRALTMPSPQEAAQSWAEGLSVTSLDQAAGTIRSYPVAYRRAILRAMSPERRAAVWRDHIEDYVSANPWLDDSVRPLIDAALTLLTPSAFDKPDRATRAQLVGIAEDVSAMIGRDAAEYLFYRLGPRDGTFASAEPISHRLASYVRGFFVASARAEDCDCRVSWGCDGYLTYCRANTGCTLDTEWPMCGWFWNQTCDGLCFAGIE